MAVAAGAVEQQGEQLAGLLVIAHQVFAFRQLQHQMPGVVIGAVPGVGGHQGAGLQQIGPGRGGGGRRLGLAGGQHIEADQPLALGGLLDQPRPLVELVHHVENIRFHRGRGHALQQPAADLQMQGGAPLLGDRAVGGFLHPVMGEGQTVARAEQELGAQRLFHRRQDGVLAAVIDHGQGGEVGAAAQTGDALQVGAHRFRQAAKAVGHQFDDVVGEALFADARNAPHPAADGAVEAEKLVVHQRGQELDGEERIAAGLVVHQFDQRRHLGGVGVQRVGHQPAEVVARQRRQHDIGHRQAALADIGQRQHQRVGAVHLVVAERADQQQMPHVRVAQQMLQQLQAAGVDPLQVVQEQHQGLVGPREHHQEAAEHRQEAHQRLVGRQFGQSRLLADQVLKLRDQVDHQPAVLAHRLADGVAPGGGFVLAARQDLAHQGVEGLGEGGIGDVALVLVELAGAEQAAPRHHGDVDLIHQRGLADAGIARHQHQLGCSLDRYPVEGGQQAAGFVLAAIQGLGHQQAFGDVLAGQGEGRDGAGGLQLQQAARQVGGEAGGGLVALLGGLGQQLQDDVRHRAGQSVDPLGRAGRLAGDVAVDPFHRIGGAERKLAGDQLVQGDAQGIQVAAGIHRPVHAPGLFGGDIGQGADDGGGRFAALLLAGNARGGAEAGDPRRAGQGIHQQGAGMDGLVHQLVPVHALHRRGDGDGDLQHPGQLAARQAAGPPGDDPRQRLAARVFQQQRRLAAGLGQRQRTNRPAGIQQPGQLPFVTQPRQGRRRRPLEGRCQHQYGRSVVEEAPRQDQLTVPPQLLCHHVSCDLAHAPKLPTPWACGPDRLPKRQRSPASGYRSY